jgi:hypothetical protein
MVSLCKRLAAFPVAALIAAAVLVLSACPPQTEKQAGQEKGPTKESLELFSFIPDGDYNLLCFLDIDKISGSAFGQRIIEFSPAYNVWNQKLGVGMEKINRIAIAAKYIEDSKRPAEAIVLMWGIPNEEWIFEKLGRKREYFKKEEVEGTSLYTLEDFAFALLDKKLLAIGTPEIIRDSLRLARGKGKSLTSGGRLSKYEKYLRQEDSFWLTIDGIDKIISPLAERETILKGFSTLRSGVLAASFKKDVDFRVQVTCASEEDASQIASSLMTLVGMLNLVIKNADFDDLPQEIEPRELRRNLVAMLESISVASEGTLVTFTFTAPQKILDYLARVAKEIVTEDDAA